jgi:uncharacterized repeat protein (TIGR01451 family)
MIWMKYTIMGLTLLWLSFLAFASSESSITDPSFLEISKYLIKDGTQTGTDSIYWIKITNDGNILLKDLEVTDLLPPKIIYQDSNLLGKKDVLLSKCREDNEDGTTKKVIWGIGDLNTGQTKWIELKVQRENSQINDLYDKIIARGKIPSGDSLVWSKGGISNKKQESSKKDQEIPKGVHAKLLLTDIKGRSPNKEADYLFELRNQGPNSLNNVQIIAQLSPNAEYLNDVCWRTADLGDGKLVFVRDILCRPSVESQPLYGGLAIWSLGNIPPGNGVRLELALKSNELKDFLAQRVQIRGEDKGRVFSYLVRSLDGRN